MSFYRDQLENYLKTIDVKAETVFDVGGKEKPVKGRTKSWTVKNYEILDIPDHDLNVLFPNPKQCNLIFCLEVFEYLIDPVTAMKNIKNMLAKGGEAIVSFPLVYPVHNDVAFDSLRFTETGVRRLAKYVGLTVKSINYTSSGRCRRCRP
jgi:SAM-dependent methyltransferase